MIEPLFDPDHFADVKRDMLDYYEGETMTIDANRVADLVNQRDKLLSLYRELSTALDAHQITLTRAIEEGYDYERGAAKWVQGEVSRLLKQL